MKKQVAVHKPWLNREPQPIVLPMSSPVRRLLPLQSEVTITLPVASRARVCGACFVSVDADACFCGMCGNQLEQVSREVIFC